MNFRVSMKPLPKVCRTIIIEYFKHRNYLIGRGLLLNLEKMMVSALHKD